MSLRLRMPVIITTGFSDQASPEIASRLGGGGVLTKPRKVKIFIRGPNWPNEALDPDNLPGCGPRNRDWEEGGASWYPPGLEE